MPIGCGKCIECRKQKADNWKIRLYEEVKTDKTGKFVTLTFSDESLIKLWDYCEQKNYSSYNKDNDIATKAVRLFLERYRKQYKKSMKHWLITELGHTGTERIHLHGILFTAVNKEEIERLWSYGYVYIGDFVNEKTVNYIVKYVTKVDAQHKNYEPKVLTSAGIGKNYLTNGKNVNRYIGEDTKDYYRTTQGYKKRLPIYYRNYIYTEEERELLWMQKLDKEERYVMGEKVDVKDDEENYFNLLNYYRRVNKSMGYGDDSLDWDAKLYKTNLNYLKLKTKLNKIQKKDVRFANTKTHLS